MPLNRGEFSSQRPIFMMQALNSDGDVVTLGDNTRVEFAPTVVPQITHENDSNIEEVTDNCGRTEVQKNGDTNWAVTVQSAYGLRPEMFQLMKFQEIDATPRVVTDLYVGQIEIQNIQIKQTTSQNIGVIKELPQQFALPESQGEFESEIINYNGQTQQLNTFTPYSDEPEQTESNEVRIYDYQIQLKQKSDETGGIQ